MLGAWNVNVITGGMPQKVATAVSKLNELVGAEYSPIAYIGSQEVNGTNHAVLCEQTITNGKDTKNIVLVIFNEKPNTIEATLVSIERVVEGSNAMGGISVDAKTEIPADAKTAFDNAFEGFVGSTVKPFALLGTQVVNGINYIFAAEVTPVTANPVKTVCVVTVGSDGSVNFDDIFGKKTKLLGYSFTWLSRVANAVGAWDVNVAVGSMPEKVASAFVDLFGSLVGAEYTPIAYIGQQVVNGINHAILAEQTLILQRSVKNIVLITINESGDKFTTVSIKNLVEGGIGFGAVEIDVETEINKTAQALFDAKLAGFVGSVIEPFALLGTQVVRGINYIYAATCTPVLADGATTKAVIVILNSITDDIQIIDMLQPEINRSLGKPLGEWP